MGGGVIEIMVFLIAVTLEKQKKNYFQNLFLLKRFLFLEIMVFLVAVTLEKQKKKLLSKSFSLEKVFISRKSEYFQEVFCK